MESPIERENSIEQLLIDLKNAASIPAKQRATKISSLVDEICSNAYDDGLSSASLEQLIDTISLPNQLDQASIGNLIRNLYPASRVLNSAVIKVVGSLGHGRSKPSYTAQAALLKWLLMVYDVLQDQRVLSRLYSVIFNLLDTIAIRTHVCHVLSLITRRKHVRPFRIQALMELTRQAGNDPPLVGLMRIYKDYYPDVILGEVTTGRASVFTHPNPEWRQRLGDIQDAYLQKTQDTRPPEQPNFKVIRQGINGAKKSRSSIIPEVHTSYAHEASVTLEEVESVNDFIDRLDKIELPNQMVASLRDPLLQKFLQLKPSVNTSLRIDQWLLAFFEDQLETPGSERTILEMLETIRHYTNHTKKLPLGCRRYLLSMIPEWNGITGRQVVLDLLMYTPIGPFEELYESILQPLEDSVLEDSTLESKLALLTFYTCLLQQWALSLLLTTQHPFSPGLAVSTLTSHVNILALTILQTSLNLRTCSAVLDFYETITYFTLNPELRTKVRIITPPAELVYTLFFTQSLCTLSRLCAVLASYKRAFEVAMAPTATEQQSYSKDYVNHFNGLLMDLCNCLWKSRAFNTTDINALGCLVSGSVVTTLAKYVSNLDTGIEMPALFSLSFSPITCLLSIKYMREIEDAADDIEFRHAGPVTQASLKALQRSGGMNISWADYRLAVLRYLDNKGAPGVGQLMYNTIKNLMAAREK